MDHPHNHPYIRRQLLSHLLCTRHSLRNDWSNKGWEYMRQMDLLHSHLWKWMDEQMNEFIKKYISQTKWQTCIYIQPWRLETRNQHWLRKALASMGHRYIWQMDHRWNLWDICKWLLLLCFHIQHLYHKGLDRKGLLGNLSRDLQRCRFGMYIPKIELSLISRTMHHLV